MSHNLIQDALFSAKSVAQLGPNCYRRARYCRHYLNEARWPGSADELLESFGSPSLLSIFCGSGNNAGDGYIAAALAAAKNIPVQVVELSDKLSPDAAQAKQFAERGQCQLCPL